MRTYARILGALLMIVQIYIICADRLLVVQGRSEETAIAVIIALNTAMGHSPWEAWVVYFIPIVIGVMAVFMPQYVRRQI
ncbi:MAG: hypothetical protein Q8Q95_00640 [bacterium]|nr:hypothetical protein [bacterium]